MATIKFSFNTYRSTVNHGSLCRSNVQKKYYVLTQRHVDTDSKTPHKPVLTSLYGKSPRATCGRLQKRLKEVPQREARNEVPHFPWNFLTVFPTTMTEYFRWSTSTHSLNYLHRQQSTWCSFSGISHTFFTILYHETLWGDGQDTDLVLEVLFAVPIHNRWQDLSVTLGIPIHSLLTSGMLGSSNGWKASWIVVESLGSCPASEPEIWHEKQENVHCVVGMQFAFEQRHVYKDTGSSDT